MTNTRSGQPKIQEWERVRIKAWTELVRKETQFKMDRYLVGKLDQDLPFFSSARLLADRWRVPQRQSQSKNTVTMNDLGAIFLGTREGGETRTDFSAYAKGQNARPKISLLETVDRSLPGTLAYYNVGPFGLPLWAALQGKGDETSFWSPLLTAKTFRATVWHEQVKIIRSLSPEMETKKLLVETSWQSWVPILSTQIQSANSAAAELRGLAVIVALVVKMSSKTLNLTGLLEKEMLLSMLPTLNQVWPLFDQTFQLNDQQATPNSRQSFVGEYVAKLQNTIESQVLSAKEEGLL